MCTTNLQFMQTVRCQPVPTATSPLVLLITLAAGWAGTPIQLQPPVTVQAGAAPLDLGDHAIPCATDWNGDGLKDLLLGYRPVDKIAVFLNIGSGAQPAFQSSTHLQAAGADIQ